MSEVAEMIVWVFMTGGHGMWYDVEIAGVYAEFDAALAVLADRVDDNDGEGWDQADIESARVAGYVSAFEGGAWIEAREVA